MSPALGSRDFITELPGKFMCLLLLLVCDCIFQIIYVFDILKFYTMDMILDNMTTIFSPYWIP